MFNFLKNGMGMSLVRHALTWGSGILVAKGTITADMATQVVSLAVGAAGLLLSAQDKNAKYSQVAILEQSLGALKSKEDQEQIELTKLQKEVEEQQAVNRQLREKLFSPSEVDDVIRLNSDLSFSSERSKAVATNSGFIMSDASRTKLKGVHPLLAKVVETAMGLSVVDFKVTEGLRTKERQAELLEDNRSWVAVSKHQANEANGLGYAVDVMALPTKEGSWEWKYYEQINQAMQTAAKEHGARITWGGHWGQMDGVHFQLDGEIAKT